MGLSLNKEILSILNAGNPVEHANIFTGMRIRSLILDTLKDYTDFLLKEGYCDTDVYDEQPTAIDQFLNDTASK